jgi:hypothetical protein
MGLAFRFPEGFKPLKIRGGGNKKPTSMWYVHTKDGTCKKYTEASPEETEEYALSLLGKDTLPKPYTSSALTLACVRASLIDNVLVSAIDRSTNLFDKAFWESSAEWQRIKRRERKEKREKEEEEARQEMALAKETEEEKKDNG